MINKALSFLKDQVNASLRLRAGELPTEERVVMSNIVDVDQNDQMGLPINKIVLSLISLEEERVLKSQDNYIRTPDGRTQIANPEIKLNLYILFAAHFSNSNYDEALKFLGWVISYFQANSVFDSTTHAALDPDVRRIVLELYTLPMEQQSQLWQSLGGKFLPSVMYKVRLLAFNEQMSSREITGITEADRSLSGANR